MSISSGLALPSAEEKKELEKKDFRLYNLDILQLHHDLDSRTAHCAADKGALKCNVEAQNAAILDAF
jgi:hypothetical protein